MAPKSAARATAAVPGVDETAARANRHAHGSEPPKGARRFGERISLQEPLKVAQGLGPRKGTARIKCETFARVIRPSREHRVPWMSSL